MTAEERAAHITTDWTAIEVMRHVAGADSGRILLTGDAAVVARELIADAIREAVAEEREACIAAVQSLSVRDDFDGCRGYRDSAVDALKARGATPPC